MNLTSTVAFLWPTTLAVRPAFHNPILIFSSSLSGSFCSISRDILMLPDATWAPAGNTGLEHPWQRNCLFQTYIYIHLQTPLCRQGFGFYRQQLCLRLPSHYLECFQEKYLPFKIVTWRAGQSQLPLSFLCTASPVLWMLQPANGHTPCGFDYWQIVLQIEANLVKRVVKKENNTCVCNSRKYRRLDAKSHVPNVNQDLRNVTSVLHLTVWDSCGILYRGETHSTNAWLSQQFFPSKPVPNYSVMKRGPGASCGPFRMSLEKKKKLVHQIESQLLWLSSTVHHDGKNTGLETKGFIR